MKAVVPIKIKKEEIDLFGEYEVLITLVVAFSRYDVALKNEELNNWFYIRNVHNVIHSQQLDYANDLCYYKFVFYNIDAAIDFGLTFDDSFTESHAVFAKLQFG